MLHPVVLTVLKYAALLHCCITQGHQKQSTTCLVCCAAQVSEFVISETVAAMWRHGVLLEGCLLKPQMVMAGADYSGVKATPQEVAQRSITAFRR